MVGATGVVDRTSEGKRIARSVGIVVLSVILGAATLPIPLIHMGAPWMFPLLGITAAVFIYRVEGRVREVRATCPGCSDAVHVEDAGSIGDDDLWIRCGGCNLPLQVLVVD